MAKVVVNIDGMENLQLRVEEKFLEDIPKVLLFAAQDAMTLTVESDARELCPSDTGYLRKSITTQTETFTKGITSIITGPTAKYGKFEEFGTGKYATMPRISSRKRWRYLYTGKKGRRGFRWTEGQRPHPYMRPAFDMNKGTITGVFKGTVIKRLMERRGLKLPPVPSQGTV